LKKIGRFLLTTIIFYIGAWLIALVGPIICNAIFGFLQEASNSLIVYKGCLYVFGLYFPICVFIWVVAKIRWTYSPGLASVVAYLLLMLPLIFSNRYIARGMEIESQLTYLIVAAAPIILFYLSGNFGVHSRKHNKPVELTGV